MEIDPFWWRYRHGLVVFWRLFKGKSKKILVADLRIKLFVGNTIFIEGVQLVVCRKNIFERLGGSERVDVSCDELPSRLSVLQ